MNRKKQAEKATRLISHNNASVKTAHLFQQKNLMSKLREFVEVWLIPFANRKEECQRHKKCRKSSLIKPLKFESSRKVCQSERQKKISVKFIRQAVIKSLVVRNPCSLWTARLEFQVAKKTSWLIAKMKVSPHLRRSVQSPQGIHVRCVEIKLQRLSRTDVGSNPVKLYFRSNVGVP